MGICKCEGKYGILSTNGLYLHIPEYDTLSDFNGGAAVFSRKGVYGVIASTGRTVMDGLEDARPFNEDGLAWFKKDGKWKVCDAAGNVVFAKGFDNLPTALSSNLYIIENDGFFGLFSMKDGKTVLPATYQHISLMEDGMVKIAQNGKYGIANASGKVIVAPSMYSDQIAEGYEFYQYFGKDDAERPALKAFYKGKAMNLKQLGEAIPQKHERFPDWLRLNVKADMPREEYNALWKSEKAYTPELQFTSPYEIPACEGVYAVVGRDFSVVESLGMGIDAGETLKDAALKVGGSTIPCGSWLAQLVSSIDEAKIAQYDSRMGTSVSQWSNAAVYVRNLGMAGDGDAVAVVDVKVEGVQKQRVFVKFARTGTAKLNLAFDGILYNKDAYVHDGDSKCFVTGSKIVLPVCIGSEKLLETRLYTKAGKLITGLGDLYCDIVFADAKDLEMVGKDAYFFCRSEVNMGARKYTKKDIGLDAEKFDVKYAGGYLYFFDKETGLMKCFLEAHQESAPTPVLRYTDAWWDGQRIVGVSVNLWDYMEETKWFYIPRIESGSFSENINGYMVTVYPVGREGIAVYSVSPDIWTNEGLRYGYIGYDGNYFTQPIYEVARDFMNGTADVKINGEWKKISKEDCIMAQPLQ